MRELKPINHPDYQCPKDGWFHDYDHKVADTEHVLIETCVRCGHTIQFNKVKGGKIDNKRYLATHQLWFLQPNHPFFKKYYPNAEPVQVQRKKTRAEIKDDYKEELARRVYGKQSKSYY